MSVAINDGAGDSKVSIAVPDWSREALRPGEWNPGKRLLASLRDYQRHTASPSWWSAQVLRRVAVLRHRFWSAVSGADIPLNSHIGGGLLLPHPNGVVIHPAARVGVNCLIFQQVTLGTRGNGKAPVLGDRVDVGAGAKLLGGHHGGGRCGDRRQRRGDGGCTSRCGSCGCSCWRFITRWLVKEGSKIRSAYDYFAMGNG